MFCIQGEERNVAASGSNADGAPEMCDVRGFSCSSSPVLRDSASVALAEFGSLRFSVLRVTC